MIRAWLRRWLGIEACEGRQDLQARDVMHFGAILQEQADSLNRVAAAGADRDEALEKRQQSTAKALSLLETRVTGRERARGIAQASEDGKPAPYPPL